MPAHHALAYRSLFAHPELVRELVTNFTPFKLFDDVALSSFEPVDPVYVSERLAGRQNDIVWRVRIGEQFLYVYILLEFQSGVDRWMALRMQNYCGFAVPEPGQAASIAAVFALAAGAAAGVLQRRAALERQHRPGHAAHGRVHRTGAVPAIPALRPDRPAAPGHGGAGSQCHPAGAAISDGTFERFRGQKHDLARARHLVQRCAASELDALGGGMD
ncbi:hypothetical protein F2P46_08575 [Massilia sp. CCM 8734]|nr:hypothetical protein [Massilia sp. CCM 8734]